MSEKPITGEVQEQVGDRWRTAHLGDSVPVHDRRIIDRPRRPGQTFESCPGATGSPDPDAAPCPQFPDGAHRCAHPAFLSSKARGDLTDVRDRLTAILEGVDR